MRQLTASFCKLGGLKGGVQHGTNSKSPKSLDKRPYKKCRPPSQQHDVDGRLDGDVRVYSLAQKLK
jgi:hypothetical protein